MGSIYTAVTTSNYNSNPPSDDGSQTPSNRVQWSTQKTKLTDPIKTAYDTSEANTATAFAKTFGAAGITSVSSNYTVSASDQGKLIVVTGSGGITITTPDATSVNAPFTFALLNNSSASITLAGNNPGVQQTVDGANSITVPAGNGMVASTDGTNWLSFGQNFTKSFPPPSAFKNLSIKVTGNTGVTLAADYVAVTDGSRFQTLAFSQAINMASTGAGALDTGSIAQATWYAIWAIAKADGTTSAIASTSGTSPTMPSGYTYKARVGWVRTASGSAQLMGTWQFGRRVQYVVGLAQTTATVPIGNTSSATLAALPVSNFVPTTASTIFLTVVLSQAGTFAVSPNNQTSTALGTTNPSPMIGGDGTVATSLTGSFILESTSIYAACSAGGIYAFCLGWDDNI